MGERVRKEELRTKKAVRWIEVKEKKEKTKREKEVKKM